MDTGSETALPEGFKRLEDGFIIDTPSMSEEHLKVISQMELHTQDIFVVGHPKCGNVWMMTLVGAILADDLDEFKLKGTPFFRGPLELLHCWDLIKTGLSTRPTVFMSHLPYHYLPKDVGEKGIKIIHKTRNPKDALVSLHNFVKVNKTIKIKASLDECITLSLNGAMPYGSWFDFMKGWLQHKDDPNVLMVQYEELKKKPISSIKEVASFLGKEVSDERISRISEMVSFSSMQQNEKLDVRAPILDETKGRFMRKGRVGDWKNYFNEEQNKKVDAKYEQFVKDTGYTIDFE